MKIKVAFLILMSFFVFQAVSAEKLILAVPDDFPIFTERLENGELSGYSVDFWTAWSQATGIEIEVRVMPWKQAMDAVESGQVDFASPSLFTEERHERFDFSDPVLEDEYQIFSFGKPVDRLKNVQGLRVAFPKGYLGQELFVNFLEKKNQVFLYSTFKELIQKIETKEIDAFFSFGLITQWWIRKMGYQDEIYSSARSFFPLPLYAIVKKGSPRLLKLLNQGIEKISSSQKDSFEKKWFPQEKSVGMPFFLKIISILGLVLISGLLWAAVLKRKVRHMKGKVQETEVKFSKAFYSLLDVLMIVRVSDGRIIKANPAFFKILGYEEEDVNGKTTLEIRLWPDPEERIRFVEEVRAEGSIYEKEEFFRKKDGVILLMKLTSSLIDLDGEECVISIMRDITQQRAAEEELKTAKEKAEEASRVKSEFLANMSHELRTPMNGIIGMTDILQMMEQDAEKKGYLSLITQSSWNLVGIIDDILDFTRFEADQGKLESVEFSLLTLIRESIDLFRSAAYAKGIEMTLEYDPEEVPFFIGDVYRIKKVLNNILGNAIKFTEKGEINLKVASEKMPGGICWVQFEIKDSGIGIDTRHLPFIFDRFYQVDASTTRRYGGAGLGLTLAKSLVQAMGGTIEVSSTLGTGSRFSFKISLKRSFRGFLPLSDEDLSGFPVLILDAHSTTAQILTQILTRRGGQVVVLSSLNENQIFFRNLPPQAILIDERFYKEDQEGLMNWMKKYEQYAVPVILMSAVDWKSMKDSSKKIFYDTILKPVDNESLLSIIFKIKKNQKEVSFMETKPKDGEGKQKKMVLLAEDNGINQLTTKIMLKNMGFEVVCAENGQEALELFEKEKVDLILMDVQMPIMNGMEATEAIRKMEKGRDVPIVALTAYALKGDRERILASGMNDYIAKPCTGKDIYEVIKKYL